MNQTGISTIEAQSAYISSPSVRVSEHYMGVRLFGPIILSGGPLLRDPLAFSPARLTAGEADVEAGRVKPLTDVLNGLRAGDHPDGR